METTKEQVFESVLEESKRFCDDFSLVLDANHLSETLAISRSVISRYLNELYSEGSLIKITSRPVYYLSKKIIEEYFNISLTNQCFYDVDELIGVIKESSRKTKDIFDSIIGYDFSLSSCISQIKSSIKYPPYGLPLFIYGEHGTGKNNIVKKAIEYAKIEGYVKKDCPIVSYWYEGQDISSWDSYLYKAQNGFLIVKDTEKIPETKLTYLFPKIRQRCSVFNNERFNISCRIIFLYNSSSLNSLQKIICEEIPVIVKVPSLEERGNVDKEKLVVAQLKNEEKLTGKKFYLKENVFKFIVSSKYSRNITGLESYIKNICAKACSNSIDNNVEIKVSHLLDNSESMIDKIDLIDKADASMYSIEFFEQKDKLFKSHCFFDTICADYAQYKQGTIDKEQWQTNYMRAMQNYSKELESDFSKIGENQEFIADCIQKTIFEYAEKFNLYISTNATKNVGYILMQLNLYGNYFKNEDINESLCNIKGQLLEENAIIYRFCEIIKNSINTNLDIEIDELSFIYLYIYFSYYNHEVNKRKAMGIIIAHGKSTATSIAEVANHLVSGFVFEPIDMPLDTSVNQIADTLVNRIKQYYNRKNLVILVDIGSLEKIGEIISNEIDASILIINNVSTGIALEIGTKLNIGCNIKEIYESLDNTDSSTFMINKKLLTKRFKQKAIVVTSEADISVSERISQLLQSSLPKQLDIKMIVYDYFALVKNKDSDSIFESYDPLFVCGSSGIEFEHIPFIHLNDLTNDLNKELIEKYFADYLNKEEMDTFRMNLIKNLSLNNIMNYLSVLNVNLLVSQIEQMIIHLQDLLGVTFSSASLLAAYLHISNLVERLVIGKYSEVDYGPISEGIIKLQEMQNAFAPMEKKYNISIPKQELLYIGNHLLWEKPIQ